MNGTPTADTHSPWFEAFSPAQEPHATHWLPGTAFPAPQAEAGPSPAQRADDRWATEALFECYNG